MRKFKLLFLILAFSFLFTSCGKKEQTMEKKETKTDTKQTTTNQSNQMKFFALSSAKETGKNEAPDIKWNENGKAASISDLKGKVVLVNLWATWCKPCVGEMPDLSKIYNELKDKGFEMIGISVMPGQDSKPVGEFLQSNPVSYTIIEGNDDVVKAFSKSIGSEINSIPRTFIIDKTGKIVEKIEGVQREKNKEHIQSLVEKYLK